MHDTLVPVRMTVDMDAILAYAEITGDFNPIHVDPEFAARTPLGGVIAHGTMSSNLVLQSIASTLGRDAMRGCVLDVRFARPVRVGDRLEAGGALVQAPCGFEVWVRNQDGETVIDGTATLAAGT